MLTLETLQSVLDAAPRMSIGLIGDLFLDRYLELMPGLEELSIETGLEAYQIENVRNSAGALGTVMNNLAAIGVGRLVPVTVIGDDGHGYDLRRCLTSLPVDDAHIVQVANRLTPTYTKPLRPLVASADSAPSPMPWHELNRLDVRTRSPLSDPAIDEVRRRVAEVFEEVDALIVLDQISERNHGVIHDRVRATLDELARRDPSRPLLVDSRSHLGLFSDGVHKGNEAEFRAATRFAAGHDERLTKSDLECCVAATAERTRRPAFCTVGERGIVVAEPERQPIVVRGFRVAGPIDIVGAGDSATTGIVAALVAGVSPCDAAMIGNLVASITVQKLGTTGVATPAELLERFAAWTAACNSTDSLGQSDSPSV